MRNTGFLVAALVLLVLQGNLHFVVDRLHLAGCEPTLTLPLILYMGVHEYSVPRGAALAFVMGYVLDLFASAPVGLFTFTSVVSFLLARAAGVRFAAQTVLPQIALALAFAAIEGVVVVVLLTIFGKSETVYRPRQLLAAIPVHALATAVVAPLVFRVADKIHVVTAGTLREGGARR